MEKEVVAILQSKFDEVGISYEIVEPKPGRGNIVARIDMKHMAALSVILLCFIQKSGVKLSRDLIFAGLADEERTDSAYGVQGSLFCRLT